MSSLFILLLSGSFFPFQEKKNCCVKLHPENQQYHAGWNQKNVIHSFLLKWMILQTIMSCMNGSVVWMMSVRHIPRQLFPVNVNFPFGWCILSLHELATGRAQTFPMLPPLSPLSLGTSLIFTACYFANDAHVNLQGPKASKQVR